MNIKRNYKYLLSDLSALKGIGIKTTNLLKKKKIILICYLKILNLMKKNNGGETGIRTQERVAPLPVFKTGAFNRSAISPCTSFYN